MKRFPRGELQRTTHHSDSCTLCQRYSLEPSTLKANEPDKTFKQHEKGKLEIGKHKMNEVWLMRLECEASVHCLSWRSPGLCICLWPDQSHRSSQCCSLTGECCALPSLCGYTAGTHRTTHTTQKKMYTCIFLTKSTAHLFSVCGRKWR